MQVLYDEGSSKPHRPPSRAQASVRTSARSVGRGTGRPAIEPRQKTNPGAFLDAVCVAEGDMFRRSASASVLDDPAWSKNLARTHAPCTGTGRSLGRPKAPLG